MEIIQIGNSIFRKNEGYIEYKSLIDDGAILVDKDTKEPFSAAVFEDMKSKWGRMTLVAFAKMLFISGDIKNIRVIRKAEGVF